jgi:outer membrane protein TolC
MRLREVLPLAGVLVLVVQACGCNAPPVGRVEEIARFQGEMQKRMEVLNLDRAEPLTLERCREIALANSLDLEIRQMSLRLTDQRVRLAFTGFLPRLSAQYDNIDRSNRPDMKLEIPGAPAGGDSGFSFQEKRTESFVVQGMLPVLDFGITYYAYQSALDRGRQEYLLLERSRQVLVRDVSTAYARYAGALRQQKLSMVAHEAALQVLRVARNLEKEAMTVRADTVLIEAAVAQTALQVSEDARKVQDNRVVLAQLLSLPPDFPLTIVEDLPAVPEPPSVVELTEWQMRALALRPELSVQDLQRHLSANAVRSAAAELLPRIDAVGSFNWSNASMMVNPSYFLYGFRISSALLDGGAGLVRYELAKTAEDIERQRSILLSLGVLYDVELRAVNVKQLWDKVAAAGVYEKARREALARTISLYREGLADEATTAQAIQNLTIEASALDRAQTDYLVAWYELEAAALPAESPTARAATRPAATRPGGDLWPPPTTLPTEMP